MKKNLFIYWISTLLFSLMMILSGILYLIGQKEIVEGFAKIGFPDFFRIELGIAKIVGALVLIIPAVPNKFKEWAYGCFVVNLISAGVAHYAVGDSVKDIIMPILFFIVLMISNFYLYKKSK